MTFSHETQQVKEAADAIVRELLRPDYVPTGQGDLIHFLAGFSERSFYQAAILSLVRDGTIAVCPDWNVRIRKRPPYPHLQQ